MLSSQGATTTELNQRAPNETTELKFQKMLVCGCQAQLQQLRQQLETGHEPKMNNLTMEGLRKQSRPSRRISRA
jgi:hypothetical protein